MDPRMVKIRAKDDRRIAGTDIFPFISARPPLQNHRQVKGNHERLIKQKKLSVSGSYDIVVAGGGVAGLAAALAASRNGARTLLLERNGLIGGDGLFRTDDLLGGQRHPEACLMPSCG